MDNPVPLIMVVVYLVGTTVISFFFSKKASKNAEQYFVAERSLTLVLSIALLFSEIIAGAGTIGNASDAFKTGLSSVWANWGMTIGCILFLVSVARFYRAVGVAKGAMSIPQAYYFMFDTKTRVALMFIVVIAYTMMYSTQAKAAASIVAPLLGVDVGLVAWVITALFILVTVTGGISGIAWMNVVHSVVMYIGMAVVCVVALVSVGGFGTLAENLPASHFDFMYPSIPTTVAYALGTAISFLASSNVTNVSFSAKTFKISKKAILIAGALVVPFALMPALIGLCARVVMPDIPPDSALFTMANSLGPAFGGLVSMAILAAIWSTAPALLLVICASLTKDLYKGILKKEASDKSQMVFSRVMAAIIGIAGTALGLAVPSILGQMLGAFQIRSVVGIVLVAAIVWKKVSPTAAFWSIVSGGVVALVWHFTGNPFGIAPLWPTVVACLVVLIPITLASKKKVSDGYLMYKASLKEMEQYEIKAEADEKEEKRAKKAAKAAARAGK